MLRRGSNPFRYHTDMMLSSFTVPQLISWHIPRLLSGRSSGVFGSRNGSNLQAVFITNTASDSKGSNDSVLSLPSQFLRASDSANFDSVTFQRNDVPYDNDNGKPLPKSRDHLNNCKIADYSFDEQTDTYCIRWEDGHTSQYTQTWVQNELSKWQSKGNQSLKLWAQLTEEKVRDPEYKLMVPFQETVMTEEGSSHALQALYQYGIVLVTGTPTDDGGSGVAALAAALGGGSVKEGNSTSLLNTYRRHPEFHSIVIPHGTDGPLRTLYGTVWSTSSSGQPEGASVADSAYTNNGLPLHTDMTYLRDPPGLQIFTMDQPAIKGGESVFGDGYAIAERLRAINTKAFETLSQTIRQYCCIDEATGWHLEAHGPVISVRNGQVVGIRHNDLDRLPDLPPLEWTGKEQTFYDNLVEAHHAWDELISSDEFRLVVSLQPGDTMVVANQVSTLR